MNPAMQKCITRRKLLRKCQRMCDVCEVHCKAGVRRCGGGGELRALNVLKIESVQQKMRSKITEVDL